MKPNIVLTIADDQRAGALGCAGVEPVSTPQLDTLAGRGVRLCRAYHHGSNVAAVCAPSRAMLHTGLPYDQLDESLLGPTREPARAVAGHEAAMPGQASSAGAPSIPTTLGQTLRETGYTCLAAGKWHNGIDAFNASFDEGRAIFFGGMADHWFTPVHDWDPTGQYPPAHAQPGRGHSTDVFGQAAVDLINAQAGRDQPFFCYCAFTSPHDPRTPPDGYRRRYDPGSIQLPPNVADEHPFDNGELAVRDERLLGTPRDRAELRRALAGYYAMISHLDAWVGRIVEAVERIGQADNTIFVHTADHGLAMGQHGLLGKQNLYEHSIGVPLIVAGPGLAGNAVRTGLCYQHDLHPTLLELAGASSGRTAFNSLLGLIRGEDDAGREVITSRYRDRQRMVRDERFKLIQYRTQRGRHEQLFDLHDDPWEINSQANDPRAREALTRLREQLPPWP